jgi:hypothetical protein
MGRHPGNTGDHILGGDIVFMMLGTEMARHQAGIFHFIVARRIEADGIGTGRRIQNLAQHAAHGGTVGTTTQEGPHLHIPAGAPPHGVTNQFEEAFTPLGWGARKAFLPVFHDPVGLDPPPARLPVQALPGLQATHAAVDGLRSGHHVEIQVIVEGLRVQAVRPPRMRRHLVGTAAKDQAIRRACVKQRHDAGTVRGQQHAARAVILNRQGKTAEHMAAAHAAP